MKSEEEVFRDKFLWIDNNTLPISDVPVPKRNPSFIRATTSNMSMSNKCS